MSSSRFTGLPAAATIRSPRSIPAASAGLPSSTPRTSRPSRSGRPTERRSLRATWGGAMAMPSRGRRGASPRPSASTRRRSAASAGQRQDQAAVHAHGVDADQPAVGVDQRAAGRSARERRGVLDRAADAAAARPAERAARRRHEPERRAQPAAAGVGEREHDACRSRARPRSAHSTGGASPVSTAIDGDVGVDVDAGDRAGLAAPVARTRRRPPRRAGCARSSAPARRRRRPPSRVPSRDRDRRPTARRARLRRRPNALNSSRTAMR